MAASQTGPTERTGTSKPGVAVRTVRTMVAVLGVPVRRANTSACPPWLYFVAADCFVINYGGGLYLELDVDEDLALHRVRRLAAAAGTLVPTACLCCAGVWATTRRKMRRACAQASIPLFGFSSRLNSTSSRSVKR